MRRVEKAFAAAVQERVIDPWWQSVRRWLMGQGAWPEDPDGLEGLLAREVPVDVEALAEVLGEFHLQAANLGGQVALERIVAGARRAGRRLEAMMLAEGAEVREAAGDDEELLSEKLSRGVGWNDIARGKSMVFNLRDPRLLARLKERGEAIAGLKDMPGDVAQSMLDALRGVLEEYGYRQGLGAKAVAEQIADIFPPTYAFRAENIARTETLVAQGMAEHECYIKNGVEKHQWAALLDSRTRPEHAAAHGQVVALGEPFIVGGEALLHPGDPAGSPENICQCRCDAYPVIDDDTELQVQPWTGGYQPLDEEMGARANAAPQVMP